jgi:Putative metallopeptidase
VDDSKATPHKQIHQTKIVQVNRQLNLKSQVIKNTKILGISKLNTLQESRYSEIDRRIRKERVLEDAAERLNKEIALPKSISLKTNECGEINAYYDPNNSSIIVCYELMEHFYKLFKKSGKSETASYDLMFDATRFVFLHELGHALIDVHEIPIAGSEEDAADRLSTYICLEQLGEQGFLR